MNRRKSKYDLYLDNLLKTVKKKGILVETMKKGTPFTFVIREQYKKDLGAVSVKNIFGNITNVYMVYEDYDGSIKYYDYPQFSKRDIRQLRKNMKNESREEFPR